MNYSLIIPTLNAGPQLGELLANLSRQSLPPQEIIVIDSASTDGTAECARDHGCVVRSIARSDFNHGGTRNLAARIATAEVLVFLTQDVLPADHRSLETILQPLDDPKIAAVCGRQLPRPDANPLASHARFFNYPSASEVKTHADIPRLGMKTAFLSNSFAAYRKSVFWEMHGFPDDAIFGEDMMLAARLILAGYGIAYEPSAAVFHSHNYNPVEEFKRYFDIGVLHARESWMQKRFGRAGSEGARYVRSELRYVRTFGPCWIGRSLLSSMIKLAGYKLGKAERFLPRSMKQTLSMNTTYWNSNN
jgi:rhamnosyltransferase